MARKKNTSHDNFPGDWVILKIDAGITFPGSEKGIFYQTIILEKKSSTSLSYSIVIRQGSMKNGPLSSYKKNVSIKNITAPFWLPPSIMNIITADFKKKSAVARKDMIKLNGVTFNCNVLENKTENGDIIKQWECVNSPLNAPLKISIKSNGKEKVILSLYKHGDLTHKIPGGKKSYIPKYYSPDSLKLNINRNGLDNYLHTQAELLYKHSLSMKGIILDTHSKKIINFNNVIKALRHIDVICIGEIHESAECHKMEIDIIKNMHRVNPRIIIGFEMFYRTFFIQKGLDDFVSGKIDEDTFRKKIYDTCWNPRWYWLYREIFLFAREKGIKMTGLNPPRELMKKFRENYHDMTSAEQEWFAREIDYTDERHKAITMRNFSVMGNMGMVTESLYPSQCIWDDTMAESIVNQIRENPGAQVIALTGGFHAGFRVTVEGRALKKAESAGISFSSRVLFPHESAWLDSSCIEEFVRLDIADYIYYVDPNEEMNGYDGDKDDRLSWMKAYKLLNDGMIDEAESSLKSDDSEMGEKILMRIRIFKKAKQLAMGGKYDEAISLATEIPEAYARGRMIWLDKIHKTGITGVWPD